MKCGLYSFDNAINGKVYVGRTVNIGKRRKHHFWALRAGVHKNAHLQAAFIKHGEAAFTFRTLLICRQEDLAFFERLVIAAYRAGEPEFGYNLMGATAEHYVHRPETNEKTSAYQRKRWENPDYRAKRSEQQKETIAKQWEDPAFRALRSESASEQWNDTGRRAAFAEKQSKAHKALWQTEEHRAKILESRGSEEHREAISARMRLRWTDPVFRAKIKESRANMKRDAKGHYLPKQVETTET